MVNIRESVLSSFPPSFRLSILPILCVDDGVNSPLQRFPETPFSPDGGRGRDGVGQFRVIQVDRDETCPTPSPTTHWGDGTGREENLIDTPPVVLVPRHPPRAAPRPRWSLILTTPSSFVPTGQGWRGGGSRRGPPVPPFQLSFGSRVPSTSKHSVQPPSRLIRLQLLSFFIPLFLLLSSGNLVSSRTLQF